MPILMGIRKRNPDESQSRLIEEVADHNISARKDLNVFNSWDHMPASYGQTQPRANQSVGWMGSILRSYPLSYRPMQPWV